MQALVEAEKLLAARHQLGPSCCVLYGSCSIQDDRESTGCGRTKIRIDTVDVDAHDAWKVSEDEGSSGAQWVDFENEFVKLRRQIRRTLGDRDAAGGASAKEKLAKIWDLVYPNGYADY